MHCIIHIMGCTDRTALYVVKSGKLASLSFEAEKLISYFGRSSSESFETHRLSPTTNCQV